MANDFKLKSTPVKSALSAFRKTISYIFFKDILDQQINQFTAKMKTYKGYHIVGMDGDDYNIKPSQDLLDNGYRGYSVTIKDQKLNEIKNETHYLKMYIVRCVDLLSGVVIGFKESSINDEIGKACELFSELPRKTIAIFDRLFLSKRLIESATKNSTYFLARCKSDKTFKEISAFYTSNKRRSSFLFTTQEGEKVTVNLIKVANPRSKKKDKFIVLATNLNIKEWKSKELANLYTLRWDCETSNRDSTSVLKLEQWHTQFYNGILQEIYAHLIIFNLTKISIYQNGGYKINLKNNITKKANFKFIFTHIVESLYKIMHNKIRGVFSKLKIFIKSTIEIRERLSRSYLRQVKRKGKQYKNASLVKKRELK